MDGLDLFFILFLAFFAVAFAWQYFSRKFLGWDN